MDKMVLIDGNSLLFRAYYATSYGQILRTKDGIPTNALLAFINMVQKVMEQEKPRYMLVAFDTGKPTFRHSQYSEYKAGKIPKAINIPVQELEWEIEELKEHIDKPILIYCKAGHKSALACEMLKEEGFTNLYNLGQGLLGYDGKVE